MNTFHAPSATAMHLLIEHRTTVVASRPASRGFLCARGTSALFSSTRAPGKMSQPISSKRQPTSSTPPLVTEKLRVCHTRHRPPRLVLTQAMSQVIKRPPFKIQEEGWGEFDLRIIVSAVDKGGDHELLHDLNFQNERYEAEHKIVSNTRPILTAWVATC